MRDPYQVLGISPGAPDEEIKRAFRQLAKELHPDIRPNDASTDRRFREVVSAYQALGAPPSRAADRAARASRAQGRQHAWGSAATMSAVFVLTVGSAAGVALWTGARKTPAQQEPGGPWAVEGGVPSIPVQPPQKVIGSSGTGEGESANVGPQLVELTAPKELSPGDEPAAQLSQPTLSKNTPAPTSDAKPVEAANANALTASAERLAKPPTTDEAGRQIATTPPSTPLTFVPTTPAKALAWTTFRDGRFGFSLGYPADVFASDPTQPNEGAAFRSRDGRARLVISASMNGTTLAAHRRSLMSGPYRGATFDYTPRGSQWFVLSGVLGDEMFYERVTFSCDRRTVHGWKLVYPVAERGFYDRIVEEVHRRYSHGNGAGGRCERFSQ